MGGTPYRTRNANLDEISFLENLLKCEDNDLCSLCRIDIEVRISQLKDKGSKCSIK